jgi:hypothetical protein
MLVATAIWSRDRAIFSVMNPAHGILGHNRKCRMQQRMRIGGYALQGFGHGPRWHVFGRGGRHAGNYAAAILPDREGLRSRRT